MRLCRREHHVARADQLDLSLIRSLAGWWAERANQDKTDAISIIRIGLNVDDMSVEDDDLLWIKLACHPCSPKHEAIGLR